MARKISKKRWKPILVKREGVALPSTLQQKLDIAQQMFDWARVQFPTYIGRWRKEYKHAEEK
ncbi:hypothetical protein HYU14_06400 [Candidatus Woesearchaeota archaeon]|nr:hypothetical protein [Candidatus Woesearchaeota archaeon]